jgi:hypothetical protein
MAQAWRTMPGLGTALLSCVLVLMFSASYFDSKLLGVICGGLAYLVMAPWLVRTA